MWAGVKLDTPTERTSPSCRSSSIVRHVSTYRPTDGFGQWMRYRSTWSVPSRRREPSSERRTESVPWSRPGSLVVRNSSSRGTPAAAIARPTPVSLP